MDSKELWIGLFALGALLFNWPFLKIFGQSLPPYLFLGWGLFIVAIAFFSIFSDRRRKGG